jgi:Cd2+/Zn2+-exporting ATPase
MSERIFHVSGMDCADCARTIEKGVAGLPNVDSSAINFTTETLKVAGSVSDDDVRSRVQELGYNLLDPDEQGAPSEAPPALNFWRYLLSRTDTRLAALATILVLPGLIFHEFFPGLGVEGAWIDLAAIAAMLIAGTPVALSAWRALTLSRRITINALMTLAAVGAVFIGAYTEAGVVMVLFVIGEALEGFTAARARRSIRGLISLTPQTAMRLRLHGDHDHEVQVDVGALVVGDRIMVQPGQRIPMDGDVLSGASSVNQAPITGESRLVSKSAGSGVFAGTINGEGVLVIQVTQLVEDNTISRMIKLVEDAQEKKAPAQRFVDRFAQYYTPAVVALAVLVAGVPPLFFGQPFFDPDPLTQGWLYRGLALLVVACPCALVISTPVTIVSAISNAARNGVLFKGGAYMEQLSQIMVIAFDKTGTLTQGRPAVVRIRAAGCEDPREDLCPACDDLLALANAVETRSEHPLAHAVVHEARHRGLQHAFPRAEQVQAIAGHGIIGTVAQDDVVIGSHPYFDQNVPHADFCSDVRSADEDGFTTLLVSKESTYQGYIAVADKVRETSQIALKMLRQAGMDRLIMLTGDNEQVAKSVASQVGLTEVVANCLPEEKLAVIEQLQRDVGPTAMIGDGINDTPALAAASLGIALGNTAQAMETADVTLMGENLTQLPFALRLSRLAMQTIRFNVVLSISIKLAFLLLVLVGLGSMWGAVLADVGTSILVILIGMRLYKYPKASTPIA